MLRSSAVLSWAHQTLCRAACACAVVVVARSWGRQHSTLIVCFEYWCNLPWWVCVFLWCSFWVVLESSRLAGVHGQLSPCAHSSLDMKNSARLVAVVSYLQSLALTLNRVSNAPPFVLHPSCASVLEGSRWRLGCEIALALVLSCSDYFRGFVEA